MCALPSLPWTLGEVWFVQLTYPPKKMVPLSFASSASLYPLIKI